MSDYLLVRSAIPLVEVTTAELELALLERKRIEAVNALRELIDKHYPDMFYMHSEIDTYGVHRIFDENNVQLKRPEVIWNDGIDSEIAYWVSYGMSHGMFAAPPVIYRCWLDKDGIDAYAESRARLYRESDL